MLVIPVHGIPEAWPLRAGGAFRPGCAAAPRRRSALRWSEWDERVTRLRAQDAERRRLSDAGPDFSEALARGLQIVSAFTEDRRQMSLSEVARAVDLPRATTRRALYTLAHLGFVETDGRLYRLTPRILRLASAYLTSNAVSTIVQPTCDRIAREVGASCTAAVLERGEVVMIARALPAQLLAAGVGIGYRLPSYCSALGRVLLSALTDAALAEEIGGMDLVAQTPFTVTDPKAIVAAVVAVREAGYAFVVQEAEHGFCSIAVPVRKFDGTLVAALNIGTRIERAAPDFIFEVCLPMLRREAEELRQQLV